MMLLAVEIERTDDDRNTRMVVEMVSCDRSRILPGSRAFIVCLSGEDASWFVPSNFFSNEPMIV